MIVIMAVVVIVVVVAVVMVRISMAVIVVVGVGRRDSRAEDGDGAQQDEKSLHGGASKRRSGQRPAGRAELHPNL
jgi:hypothetical protein